MAPLRRVQAGPDFIWAHRWVPKRPTPTGPRPRSQILLLLRAPLPSMDRRPRIFDHWRDALAALSDMTPRLILAGSWAWSWTPPIRIEPQTSPAFPAASLRVFSEHRVLAAMHQRLGAVGCERARASWLPAVPKPVDLRDRRHCLAKHPGFSDMPEWPRRCCLPRRPRSPVLDRDQQHGSNRLDRGRWHRCARLRQLATARRDRYSDFGTWNNSFALGPAPFTTTVATQLKIDTQIALVGIIYKFGGPVAARY